MLSLTWDGCQFGNLRSASCTKDPEVTENRTNKFSWKKDVTRALYTTRAQFVLYYIHNMIYKSFTLHKTFILVNQYTNINSISVK